MPVVRIAAPAPPGRKASTHPKVTLTGNGATVTLDVTNKELEVDDLAAEWEVIKRPQKRPLLAYNGPQLPRASFDALIGTDRLEEDVSPRLAQLIKLAGGSRPIFVGSTTGAGASTLAWTVTGCRYRVRRRRKGDNAILSARVWLELTEASAVEALARPGSSATTSTKALTAGRTPGQTGAPARRHTVKAGETLYTIADRHYADPNRWRAIADANGIRDPRTVRAGAVLTLPA